MERCCKESDQKKNSNERERDIAREAIPTSSRYGVCVSMFERLFAMRTYETTNNSSHDSCINISQNNVPFTR